MRFSLRLFFTCLPVIFPVSAMAEGMRATDIVGITTGMTPEVVQAKIMEYNPNMAVQKINTQPYDGIPSYVLVMSAAIAGKKDGAAPEDEITVRFARHNDGQVLSNAVSHLIFPVPESQRILFKTFKEKMAAKYGPISNMNDPQIGEVRWVFDGEGKQKLSSLSSDAEDYKRCGNTSAYINDSTTRAGLPENAVRGCGDFLYVKLFPVDTDHKDVLGGYYMVYINQDKYLNEIQGEMPEKPKDNIPEYKKLEEQKKNLQNNEAPKF